jgi:L-asparaginase
MNKKILLLNTGGTFNKIYDHISGELVVDTNALALYDIAKHWQYELDIVTIINKDSLYINTQDRIEMLSMIIQSEYNNIIIIHGTDTMELSAEYIADAEVEKKIIFTGAMQPYAIEPVEATANLAMAYGFLQECEKDGVYISMNGFIKPYDMITKDKDRGVFVPIS